VLLTVYCVVFGGVNSPRSGRSAESSPSTQSTAYSHSTAKCNRSVTVMESSPWRWPSRVETCRSVLQLMIKLSLCICWWLVFLNLVEYLHRVHHNVRCDILCETHFKEYFALTHKQIYWLSRPGWGCSVFLTMYVVFDTEVSEDCDRRVQRDEGISQCSTF
jgi:hypothetical protein